MDSKDTPESLLERKGQPELDKKYPPCNFMTVFNKMNKKTLLVGTRKNITLAAMFREEVVPDLEHLEAYAAIIADDLGLMYEDDRMARYIHAYHTPEEWDQLKEAEKVIKLNSLVKPKYKKRRKK